MPKLSEKYRFWYTVCGWCYHALGAFVHYAKVGGDSDLAQDVASVGMKTGNRPHDQPSQERFNEFFVKCVHARSAWGKKPKALKKQYKRLTHVPDWRDPSRIAEYKSVVHRWDHDRTFRERQKSQCLWDRDCAIMCDILIKERHNLSAKKLPTQT